GFNYTFGFIIWSLVCSPLHGAPACVTPGTTPVTPTTTASIPHTNKGHSTCQTKPLVHNTPLVQTSDARSESSEFKTGTTMNATQTAGRYVFCDVPEEVPMNVVLYNTKNLVFLGKTCNNQVSTSYKTVELRTSWYHTGAGRQKMNQYDALCKLHSTES
ncbi:hypothetical protein X801_00465, partial [Opisthorchis viverrini]